MPETNNRKPQTIQEQWAAEIPEQFYEIPPEKSTRKKLLERMRKAEAEKANAQIRRFVNGEK